MKYISEEDLRAHLINDGCDDGCGYLDERDIPSLPWIELDEDEKHKVGHWLDTETSYADNRTQYCKCSVCGKESARPIGNYCKWCGAKMEEQDADSD